MRALRAGACALLLFTSLVGICGGLALILRPNGSLLRLRPDLVQNSPLHSFQLPGVVLFAVVGLLGATTAWITYRRRAGYGWWIVLQGVILFQWVVVESVLVRTVVRSHLPFAFCGLLLIFLGMVLAGSGRSRRSHRARM